MIRESINVSETLSGSINGVNEEENALSAGSFLNRVTTVMSENEERETDRLGSRCCEFQEWQFQSRGPFRRDRPRPLVF